jgi:hypothetical protein
VRSNDPVQIVHDVGQVGFVLQKLYAELPSLNQEIEGISASALHVRIRQFSLFRDMHNHAFYNLEEVP